MIHHTQQAMSRRRSVPSRTMDRGGRRMRRQTLMIRDRWKLPRRSFLILLARVLVRLIRVSDLVLMRRARSEVEVYSSSRAVEVVMNILWTTRQLLSRMRVIRRRRRVNGLIRCTPSLTSLIGRRRTSWRRSLIRPRRTIRCSRS